MWLSVLHLTADDPEGEQVIVTGWGLDRVPFRVGTSLEALPSLIACLRNAAGPRGSTLPRCGACQAVLDVPDVDRLAGFDEFDFDEAA